MSSGLNWREIASNYASHLFPFRRIPWEPAALPSYLISALTVACALFMENLDSTVIATSLPAIAMDLHEDPISLKLALTSYLVSLAIFIPASGWVADRFGARKIFRIAILVFTLGSILCGMAATLPGFIAARVIQGLGGAMMVPVGRLVLLRSVERTELVNALVLSDDPSAPRAGRRAAARRLHHDLFSLALDLLDQCADRRRRHCPRDPLRGRRRGRSHMAARRDRLPSLRLRAGLSVVRAWRRRARPSALGSRGLSHRLGRSRLDRLCPARAPRRFSAASISRFSRSKPFARA